MNKRAAPTTVDLALRQSRAEFVAAIEFRHFYIGTTNLMYRVSIATSNASQIMLLSKAPGLSIKEDKWKGTSVEHLDNVNIRGKTL